MAEKPEKKTVVTGVYANRKQAEQTIADLLGAGFLRDALAITKAPEANSAGVRLVVHCGTSDEEVARAKDFLKTTGAQDISSSSEEPDQVFVES